MCSVESIYVTSFFKVFHAQVRVNIGLKILVRMVTSIPFTRCLCYKPERFRIVSICMLPPVIFHRALSFKNSMVNLHAEYFNNDNNLETVGNYGSSLMQN